MAFTDDEKARIKDFLAYPDWDDLAQSIQLGIPASSHPLFLITNAFNLLTEGGERSVRRALCECEDVERQLSEARGRMKAIQLGNLKLNPHETQQLRRELLYWIVKMADALGVIQNPYSQAIHQSLHNMGGINAKVYG